MQNLVARNLPTAAAPNPIRGMAHNDNVMQEQSKKC